MARTFVFIYMPPRFLTTLFQGEVAKRREEYSYNELQVHDDEPMWKKYLENFKVRRESEG